MSDLPAVGQKIGGRVLKFLPSAVSILLDTRHHAFLPNKHVSWDSPLASPEDFFKVGDHIDLIILKHKLSEQGETVITVGYRELIPVSTELPTIGQRLCGVVHRFLHGAAVIKLDSGSYVLLNRRHLSWANLRADAEDLFAIGDRIEIVVLQVKIRSTGQPSIKVGYKELQLGEKADILHRYPINSRHDATVADILPFGVTVELRGGVMALLHNSEVSWTERKTKASEVFMVNDEIEVIVIGMNADKGRLAVSYRMAQPNPWEMARSEYPVGSDIDGEVAKVVVWGLFVTLPNGCKGVIHKSQLPPGRPPESFSIGEKIGVTILEHIPEQQRITLRLAPEHHN